MILLKPRKTWVIRYDEYMLKHFLKSIRREIIITVMILLLFLIIFFLFSLSYRAYFLAVAIVVFMMVIYWMVALSDFKESESLKEKISKLEDELTATKNAQTHYQTEVEHYFFTWVHQIKTPITASKLLLERNEDNVVNQVRQEIIQIDNYTSLALSYLKLMNEETDMSFSKVGVDELVRPLIMKYSIQFIEQRTKIHYERIETKVLTDVQWSSILIEQLINNALKYARGKDIWIDFDSDHMKLLIRDNGVGISAADLPKIFDKGYSGYNGRLNEQSSGIGLFIVKHISEHLHLKIDVVSTLGQGTTFTIKFPQSDLEIEKK